MAFTAAELRTGLLACSRYLCMGVVQGTFGHEVQNCDLRLLPAGARGGRLRVHGLQHHLRGGGKDIAARAGVVPETSDRIDQRSNR